MKRILLSIGLLLAASPTYGATLGTSAGAPDPSSSFSATSGLFSPSSGNVAVSSTGTEMMRVDGTGVGIGTTSPDALLSLGGQTAQTIDMVRETTSSTAGQNLTIQAGGAVSGGSNLSGGSLILSSGISTGNNTSNVLVQTYPPGSSGTGDNSALTTVTISGSGTAGNNAASTITANSPPGTNQNGGTLILSSGISTGTGTSGMYFDVYGAGSSGSSSNSPTQALTIASTGNVGIGTTAPDALFSLGGQAAQVIDMVRETTASTAGNDLTIKAGGATSGGTNLNGGNLNITSGLSTGTGTSGINFKVYEAGTSGTSDNSSTTAMVITGAGVVGIGTTNPDPNALLSVVGATNPWAEVTTSGGATGKSIIIQYINSSGDYGKLQAYDYGAALVKPLILQPIGGNVGIGTTSPRGGSTLDVNGKIYVATFAASSSTTVCQNGNVLSSCSSAMRFKNNVKPTELGLKEVLEMKPVTFDFKDHKDNWEKHDFGFIAEDMAKINPLFVTYDDVGKITGVRYMQLTAVQAKAMQQLHTVVVKLSVAVFFDGPLSKDFDGLPTSASRAL